LVRGVFFPHILLILSLILGLLFQPFLIQLKEAVVHLPGAASGYRFPVRIPLTLTLSPTRRDVKGKTLHPKHHTLAKLTLSNAPFSFKHQCLSKSCSNSSKLP
jgi:hypothetical protein